MEDKKVPMNPEELNSISGGNMIRDKYISSFYCEYCGKTVRLNMVSSLERALREHNKKVHPQMIKGIYNGK